LYLLIQTNSYPQIGKNINVDFNDLIGTGVSLTSDFFKFNQSTQINLAGSVLLVGAGYALDYNMKNLAYKNISGFNNGLFSIDNVVGSEYTLIGIGALYGYGLFFDDKEVRRLGLQTIEAAGYSGLITTVLKSIVGRSRPYANEGKLKLRPFNVNAAYTSFPSGHSTVAFAVSTVLANSTDNIYLKILSYSPSALVAGARLYHNAHWFSDVIAGGLIGYFVGDYVSNRSRGSASQTSGFFINYYPGGINLTYTF
jgi:membrane-associated phospholipid phosphatase